MSEPPRLPKPSEYNSLLATPTPFNLPSPPFYHVPHVHNFRDIGGYPIPPSPQDPYYPEPNASVRRGLIYRSAALHGITEEGERVLRDELGVKKIFDLRSKLEKEDQERKGRGTPKIEGVEYVFAPVFEEQDYSPEALAQRYADYASGGVEGFTRAYAQILQEGPNAYGRILRQLAHHPDEPILYHCSGGKDRTGMVTALILGIVEVSDDIIGEDYNLTEKGMAGLMEAMVTHLCETGALGTGPDAREKAEKMCGCRKDYMIAALAMLREKYGSVEGYVRNQCGLSSEEVEKLKGNLTREVAAVL